MLAEMLTVHGRLRGYRIATLGLASSHRVDARLWGHRAAGLGDFNFSTIKFQCLWGDIRQMFFVDSNRTRSNIEQTPISTGKTSERRRKAKYRRKGGG